MKVDAATLQKLLDSSHRKSSNSYISYGTAGFRYKASELQSVLFRVGLLAAIRSHLKNAAIGVMVTASHNPEADNGAKIVDPMGEMMEQSWESLATEVANVDDKDLLKALQKLIDDHKVEEMPNACVVIGRDTRPSSQALSDAVCDGVSVFNTNVNNIGLATTPQLHYVVRCINTNGAYGEASIAGYEAKISAAFNGLRKGRSSRPKVTIDCANGVGAVALGKMLPFISDFIDISVINNGEKGVLNHQCGADFVKVQQRAPLVEGRDFAPPPGLRCASFDGDADRIVYFYHDAAGKFHLLDGDKIACLVAAQLGDLLRQSDLRLTLGLVQTAYANGASTSYIEQQLRLPVTCVPTGVKHLHHSAQQFDIGVYFEANGHGTVLFSDEAVKQIESAANSNAPDDSKEAAAKLMQLSSLINQTVGDAISDLLLVEAILDMRHWSEVDWDGMYSDLPNRQLKVKVKDRAAVKTTNAERTATAPPGLQQAIDDVVSSCAKGRAFVRPSGTENVVRVYAEADTQVTADLLAFQVATLVFNMAAGEGAAPAPP